MAERLGRPARRRGMRTGVLLAAAVAALLLAGCGDEPPVADGGRAPSASTSASATPCRSGAEPVPLVRADLDGDGAPDQVAFVPPEGSCPGALTGLQAVVPIDWDASDAARDAAAVRVPGRTGDLVLLREQHPRGGFQAHLYGYAGGTLAELVAEGKPVFDFIATDVLTTPTAATCADGGFVVTQARAHEPIGVMPAWDVYRTAYTVDGNAVTRGATTKIADNVLDAELQRRYEDLVDYAFFDDCRVRS